MTEINMTKINITSIIRDNEISVLEHYFKCRNVAQLSITDSDIGDIVQYNRIQLLNILLANLFISPIKTGSTMYFMCLDICYNSKYKIAETLIKNQIINKKAFVQLDYWHMSLSTYLLRNEQIEFFGLLQKYNQVNTQSLVKSIDDFSPKMILFLHKDIEFNRKSGKLSIIFDRISKTTNQQIKSLGAIIGFNFEFIRILDGIMKQCSLRDLSDMHTMSYIIRKYLYGF